MDAEEVLAMSLSEVMLSCSTYRTSTMRKLITRPVSRYEKMTRLRLGAIGTAGITGRSRILLSGTKPARLIRYSMSFSNRRV